MKITEKQLIILWNVFRDITLSITSVPVVGGMSQEGRKQLIQEITDQQSDNIQEIK